MRTLNSQNKQNTTGMADTMSTFVLAAGTAQADDYPTGAKYMHISSDTKLFINYSSTGAIVPAASVSATTSSTGLSVVQNPGHEHIYEVASDSTGYSLVSVTTGIAVVQYYGI